MGVRKRGPGAEDPVLVGSLQGSGVLTQKDGQKYLLPPRCFQTTLLSRHFHKVLCRHSSVFRNDHETGRQRVSLLSAFLFSSSSSLHSPKIFQSPFSEINTSRNPSFLCLVLGTKELTTLESLIKSITQEFSTRRLGDKVPFCTAPFHWLMPSLYSYRLLLSLPHPSRKLQHGNQGCYRRQCSSVRDCLFHLHKACSHFRHCTTNKAQELDIQLILLRVRQ